jgi:1-pyrroline-5-carboxylate dehydrogenase
VICEFVNEPVKTYAPGSEERAALKRALNQLSSDEADLPLIIDGAPVRTGATEPDIIPHRHRHVLANAHLAGPREVDVAIAAALRAGREWGALDHEARAAVFLKAADLLSGPWRARLNAATMLSQSKTVHQAEIDAAAELADFWRFNVQFMRDIHAVQPLSTSDARNSVDYRSLEGFVFAATPFNFTAIAGNLPSAPALMGNTVVWKPSAHAKLSAHLVLDLLTEAGLPPGVINLIHGDPGAIADHALAHPYLAGVHFTGSTDVFNVILGQVGKNRYRTYPRVVGETGGKNFILAHSSADIDVLATAIVRGAFEYQGQKCSAASRVFVPRSLWPRLRQHLCDILPTLRLGDVADFSVFMGAVINDSAFRRHAAVFEAANASADTRILAGGHADASEGYFVQPTLLETTDPRSRFMSEEFFGPIACAYVYPDENFDDVLALIDATSVYGLTGAIHAAEPSVVKKSLSALRNCAGNFYINDKPTGAVVGQQPFGGARASGTNDKAGSVWNLIRWTSPRTIKEALNPPRHFAYPHMAEP